MDMHRYPQMNRIRTSWLQNHCLSLIPLYQINIRSIFYTIEGSFATYTFTYRRTGTHACCTRMYCKENLLRMCAMDGCFTINTEVMKSLCYTLREETKWCRHNNNSTGPLKWLLVCVLPEEENARVLVKALHICSGEINEGVSEIPCCS